MLQLQFNSVGTIKRQKMFKQFLFSTIALVTLGLASAFAQKSVNQLDEEGKRHGLWTKNYHNTDQKRYEGVFVHGKEVDTFKYYTLSNGKSVLSALKVFNKKDNISDVTFLASNKKVISEGKMNGKNFVGKWVYYHKNSDKKMIEENYGNDGKLEGLRKVFYENGVIADQTNYKNGKLNGEAKWFSENEKLIKIANYENGEFHGDYVSYDKEGQVATKGTYVKDRKRGIWHYYESGEEIKRINHTTNEVLFKKE